ncbi:MAG: D-2-hydroxyacid dehydrogenase [Burkholderiaceae bacterium]
MGAPLRLLMSRQALEVLGPELRTCFADRDWQPILVGEAPPQAQAEAQLAFISRDITGTSTKFELSAALAAFYDVLRASSSLRWLHVHSAGADRPIYQELVARGVTVTTSAGANANNVAVTALASILALSRRFPSLMAAQAERRWAPLLACDMPDDLAGQHAVVVGWGPVGQAIAKRLAAFDVRISVVRRAAVSGSAGALPVFDYARLADAVCDAQWLVLACPLSPLTRGLVDARVLAALPRGASLINVARGEVIDDAALIDALRSGHLGGAHLDVFSHEPLPQASPLWEAPNLMITPHAAGHSTGNRARVSGLFLENLRCWLRSEPLRNVVPSAV